MVEIDDGAFARTVANLLNEQAKKKKLSPSEVQAEWLKIMRLSKEEKKAWLARNISPGKPGKN